MTYVIILVKIDRLTVSRDKVSIRAGARAHARARMRGKMPNTVKASIRSNSIFNAFSATVDNFPLDIDATKARNLK